jgi:hypothetical protein
MNLDFNKTLKLTFSKNLFLKTKPFMQIYGYKAHATL